MTGVPGRRRALTHQGTRLISYTEADSVATLTRVTMVGLVAGIALRVAGVPHVDLHGPLHYLGVMDPLCGGTRAMFLLTSGHPAAAAHYNPAVFPLAAAALVHLARAVLGWATGRWLVVRLSPTVRRALIAGVVVAVVALEVRQQLHPGLLMQSWP